MSRAHRLPWEEREPIVRRVTGVLDGREDVVFAYAHGSFLVEEAFRDIDVAVWMEPDADRWADVQLAIELSRVAGYPVDVRRINDAPVSFLFHVLRGRPLVVRDERLLADLIERTARIHHDRAPLLRRALREAFGT